MCAFLFSESILEVVKVFCILQSVHVDFQVLLPSWANARKLDNKEDFIDKILLINIQMDG